MSDRSANGLGPGDDELRRAIQALTRRRFLRNTAMSAGALAMGPALLAACGDDEDTASKGTSNSTTKKGSGTADNFDVYHANWQAYMDDETPGLFEEATGLKLFYSEEYNDNDEFFAKVQPELSQGNPIKPNLITPTFWMAGRYIRLGWAEELPLDKIPNSANLRDQFRNPPHDPTGAYSLPWESGIAGLAYNKKLIGREITSVDDLFDPEFSGKIGLLSEMRDTMGIIAMSLGIDITKPTFSDFGPAFDKLEAAVADGQVRRFHGNDYLDDLGSGNFLICTGWSGDVLGAENPDLAFAIPESGGTLWYDTMIVPKGATKIDAVAKWMDFVYDPVNAARIIAAWPYGSPVEGARDLLREMGGDKGALADNPLLFPDDATAERLSTFGALEEDEEQRFDERFSEIAGT